MATFFKLHKFFFIGNTNFENRAGVTYFFGKNRPKCYLRCYLILSFLVIFKIATGTTLLSLVFLNIIFISFTTCILIFFACLDNTLVWSHLERRGRLGLVVVGQARYASLKKCYLIFFFSKIGPPCYLRCYLFF